MMNLERELVFCFIEEDNIQRAYFRVRPLLTVSGDVQEEARKLWPDDGCLRIVPDRNEQHTFKDRMRTLGGYCTMDLRGIPADANKIRTNKNYKPDKGEKNQFILYSDTVHALPEHTFYEILEGAAADYAQLAAKSLTPLFYIRETDTLYGPIRKAEPVSPETAKEASGVLFPLTCPDGTEHVLLCMAQPDAPAAVPAAETKPVAEAEPAKEESLPIGKPLQILDQSKDFEETLHGLDQPLSAGANLLHQEPQSEDAFVPPAESKPLSGTPLIRANMRTSVQPPKNKLQEIVAAQWRVAKNEPHTAPLPAGAMMRQVENPVETACDSLRTAWQDAESHQQLMDFILSLDGMRAKLEKRMTEAADSTPLYKTQKARLNDLEAERLSILLQLDKAKADLDSYRRSVLSQMSEKSKEEISRLEERKASYEAALSALKAEHDALSAQREELVRRVDELQNTKLPAALAEALADAQIAAPVNGVPLRLQPVNGEKVAPNELIRRVIDVFSASGVELQRNHAIALLALLGICPRIGFASPALATAATLISNLATRLGWKSSFAHQVTPEQKPVASFTTADSTPALLLTSLAAYSPLNGITKMFLARNAFAMTRNPAYEASQWPVLPLPAFVFVPQLEANTLAAVSNAALQAFAASDAVSFEETCTVLAPILAHAMPMSGAAMKELHQFVSACAPLMDGGLTAAFDWAILLWIIPAIDKVSKAAASLKPLLEEYPLAQSALTL